MPDGAVNVTRPGDYGNPFRIGETEVVAGMGVLVTRALAVELFRAYLATRPGWRAQLRDELHGKDLVCWCPLDQPCHADVLLELANS
jgi:hypothetical protein